MQANPFWIEGPWRGRLAILPRPRGGDWLEDEVASWKQAGIQLVVSALTDDELEELDLLLEAQYCESQGLEHAAFPILDRGIPSSIQTTAELVRRLESKLRGGKTVAVHCRQGVGRSAVLAACLLLMGGVDVGTAFERIQKGRGCGVPDTEEQKSWVVRFAHSLQVAAKSDGLNR